jgi:transposase InsO family protein
MVGVDDQAGTGSAYVALAIDLFSRAIVGRQVSTVKDTSFVEARLRVALWRRNHISRPIVPGMIHHSDAGSPAGSSWVLWPATAWSNPWVGSLPASTMRP